MTFDDLKGEWVSGRTGKRVEVVSMRADSVGLRHESGRQSTKLIHYFIEEYQRPANHASRQKPTCSDCTVGRGYRPFLDFVELCPRHANQWQPIETAPLNESVLIFISSPLADHYGHGVYRGLQKETLGTRIWMVTGWHLGSDLLRPENQPTHWMPLPDAPTQQRGEA